MNCGKYSSRICRSTSPRNAAVVLVRGPHCTHTDQVCAQSGHPVGDLPREFGCSGITDQGPIQKVEGRWRFDQALSDDPSDARGCRQARMGSCSNRFKPGPRDTSRLEDGQMPNGPSKCWYESTRAHRKRDDSHHGLCDII
jgi:hypothetical protein